MDSGYRDSGMFAFTVIWGGQLVSLLGTAMTQFALLLWAYQQTGAATTLALLGFFGFGPFVVLSPLAGVWVDRVDRRLVMACADLGAGLLTATLFILYTLGRLQLWHLYVEAALAGACGAFQYPAYSAAITTLVPKEHYARASGLRSLADSAAYVVAPFLAGVLLRVFGIAGVLLIDLATFLIAIAALLLVRVPHPVRAAAELRTRDAPWQELGVGFRYIFQRPGLLGLLLIFMGINLCAALTYFSLLSAMVLARSGSDTLVLASVQSALGLGGVVGGLAVSVWGGPRRRIHGILAGAGLSFLLGDFLFAVGRSVPVWVFAGFVSMFFVPFILGANHALWQAKVAPAVQGRVFSVQGMFHTAMMPLGYLLAGPLADHLFEPAMAATGNWADACGWLVGTGPGAGMALMFVCTSLLGAGMSLSGYLFRAVRRVEEELPDQEVVTDQG